MDKGVMDLRFTQCLSSGLQCHVGSGCHLLIAGFLLGLLFGPKDGGDTILQSVGLFLNYLSLGFYLADDGQDSHMRFKVPMAVSKLWSSGI
jgi:hypothetical protein